jgi:hypothetical protein
LQLTRACGLPHPALVSTDAFEILDEKFHSQTATEVFGYAGLANRRAGRRDELAQLMEVGAANYLEGSGQRAEKESVRS